MSINLTIGKSELSESLQFLRNGLLKKDLQDPNLQLELELYKSKGIFRIKGAEYKADLECDRFAKVTLPMVVMVEVLKSLNTEQLNIEIGEHKLTTNTGIDLHHSKIKCVHPEEVTTPDLPLNYTISDILRLAKKNNKEALSQMGILDEVQKANSELDASISEAFRAIKKFKISKKEIEQFVKRSIYSDLN